MSVDTYLKQQNLTPYQALDYQDVTIYVAHSLITWAQAVHLDVKQFLFWRSFDIEAEHRHTVTCAH